MFDLDTYIANLGKNPNKIQRILMNIHEIKTKKIDDPVIESDTIDELISSMLFIEHDCDFLDIDDDQINCRYMILNEKSGYHLSLIMTMNFKKGTIFLCRYTFDNEKILSERKTNLLITDFKHICFIHEFFCLDKRKRDLYRSLYFFILRKQ